jgi:hypothetical protein
MAWGMATGPFVVTRIALPPVMNDTGNNNTLFHLLSMEIPSCVSKSICCFFDGNDPGRFV